MTSCLRIALLVCFVIATTAQDFDLFDALGDDDATPAPVPGKPPAKPKEPDNTELDLSDAFGPDPDIEKPEVPVVPKVPVAPTIKTKETGGGGGGGLDGFDLGDALGPDVEPEKPAVVPPKDGGTGGGSFGDSDLLDIGGGSDYKPDGGKSGGRASDPAPGPNGAGGAADEPQEAGSGSIAGIASAIGVALLGAASSYFAYQKKKLCFKLQGGQDPESGKDQRGTQADPQVNMNLLSSS